MKKITFDPKLNECHESCPVLIEIDRRHDALCRAREANPFSGENNLDTEINKMGQTRESLVSRCVGPLSVKYVDCGQPIKVFCSALIESA